MSAPLVDSGTSAALVDVKTVAAYLGVSVDYVYGHAAELRARRLGTGPKARLRFSLADVDDALTCSPSVLSR